MTLINATLSLGRDYEILEYEHEMVQPPPPAPPAENGEPDDGPAIKEIIKVTIEDPGDSDPQFHHWMIGNPRLKDGKITFLITTDSNKTVKRIMNFKNAYCIGLNINFDANRKFQVIMNLTIATTENSTFTSEEVPL